MTLYVLPLSPNDHPTAQGSPGVVEGHLEVAIFQPTHAGLKTAVLTMVGPYANEPQKYGTRSCGDFIRDKIWVLFTETPGAQRRPPPTPAPTPKRVLQTQSPNKSCRNYGSSHMKSKNPSNAIFLSPTPLLWAA